MINGNEQGVDETAMFCVNNLTRWIYINGCKGRKVGHEAKTTDDFRGCKKKTPRAVSWSFKRALPLWKWWPRSGRRNISSRGETARDIYSRWERLLTLFLLVNFKWRNWSAPFALNQRHGAASAIFSRRISGVRRDNSCDTHRRTKNTDKSESIRLHARALPGTFSHFGPKFSSASLSPPREFPCE